MTKKEIAIVILVVIITALNIYSLFQTSSDKLIEKARYVYGSEELFLSSYSEKHNLFTFDATIIMYNDKDIVEYEVSRFLGIIPIAEKYSTLPKNR